MANLRHAHALIHVVCQERSSFFFCVMDFWLHFRVQANHVSAGLPAWLATPRERKARRQPRIRSGPTGTIAPAGKGAGPRKEELCREHACLEAASAQSSCSRSLPFPSVPRRHSVVKKTEVLLFFSSNHQHREIVSAPRTNERPPPSARGCRGPFSGSQLTAATTCSRFSQAR